MKLDCISLIMACYLALSGCNSSKNDASPSPPRLAATAEAVSPTNQTAPELTEVFAPAVRVRDSGGNPVPGAAVTFAIVAGGGSVSGANAATGDDGVARAQRWVLGNAGPQRLEARVDGLDIPVTFSALANPAPVAIQVITSPASAQVGTSIAPAPAVAVLNASGAVSPAAGIPVTVSLLGGDGSIDGTTTQVTDAVGRAVFGDLRLMGLAVGPRLLTFSAPGLAAATSGTVIVSPGSPSAVAAISSAAQSAGAYQGVDDPPAIRVTDLGGNAVPAAPMLFEVTSGGGRLIGGAQVSGSDGVARVPAWILGGSEPQEVQARIVGGDANAVATFSATLRDSRERYDVRFRLLSPLEDDLFALLDRARVRVEQIVHGELSDIWLSTAPISYCGNVGIAETIDDLLVLVEVAPIDGAEGILAQAGPCFIRTSNRLPVMGILRLDSDDLHTMKSDEIRAVMIHELLHVLGFGAMWTDPYVNLVANAGTSDPYFVGPSARSAFEDAGGWSYSGSKVPVENVGGAGTADSHWRLSVFGEELMTGWLPSEPPPLSRTTIMSLADLGYAVDPASADPFTIASAERRSSPGHGRGVGADILPVTAMEVDEDGTIRRR